MEFFAFVACIGVIVLFFKNHHLSDRVKALESQIRKTNDGEAVSVNRVNTTPQPWTPHSVTPDNDFGDRYPEDKPVSFMPSQVSAKNLQYEKSLENNFIEWLSKDLIMKIGALFILMAIGWFVKHAFAENWIGPAGRIALGLITGVGLLALGAWRIRKYEHQGAIFLVLGSTIVLTTVTAGRVLYQFFTPLSALGLIFLSVLFVAFVSLKYHRNSLALAGLILAGMAPLFSDLPSQGLTINFTYLLTIILGTLWLVYRTGWRNLTLTALILTFVLTSPSLANPNEQELALLWVFIFTGIFFIANIVSLIRQRGGLSSGTNLFTAIGTAFFLMVWVFDVANPEVQSLLLTAWALVFAVGAYLVFRSTNFRPPFYVYGITAIILLGAATAAEFQGPALTIAFTLEFAALMLVATILKFDRSVVSSLCVLVILPIILALPSISAPTWQIGVLHDDFFVLMILILTLGAVGLFINERYPREPHEFNAGEVLAGLGFVFATILVWLVVHALFRESPDMATMITLTIYTIVGIAAYFTGRERNNTTYMVAGSALLIIVVSRLLLVDVWNMDFTGRIVTFVAIGALFISTAFIGRKEKTDNNLES